MILKNTGESENERCFGEHPKNPKYTTGEMIPLSTMVTCHVSGSRFPKTRLMGMKGNQKETRHSVGKKVDYWLRRKPTEEKDQDPPRRTCLGDAKARPTKGNQNGK